jgi:hypothetical protein
MGFVYLPGFVLPEGYHPAGQNTFFNGNNAIPPGENTSE